MIASDVITFHTFKTMIVILGGETFGGGQGEPYLPRQSNLFVMGDNLMRLGYDVHPFNEDKVESDGSGETYDRVKRHQNGHEVEAVVMAGHSHGGGSVCDLANLVDSNLTLNIALTAYIDAIGNESDTDRESESDIPPGTAYHINHWQPTPYVFIPNFTVNGVSIPTANVDLEHPTLKHNTIAESWTVLNSIINGILTQRSQR